ncbi:aminotransferase class I/II-fold pyridoxal phosphate-dependent enzyme [Paenibacillus phoenicis]
MGQIFERSGGGVPPASLDYGDIRGEEALRKEFAAYLYRTRGMRCQPVQIMIVSGSSEGFALIAQTLRDRFDVVYLEDPTIEFTLHIFRRAGYRISPVAIDGAGMKLHELPAWEPGHLMLLTPSHQFPGGGILPIQPRQLLIGTIHRHFGERAAIQGDEAGMHLMIELHGVPTGIDWWSKAQAYGVRVYGVEDYCLIQGNYTRHILLGYGNLPEEVRMSLVALLSGLSLLFSSFTVHSRMIR